MSEINVIINTKLKKNYSNFIWGLNFCNDQLNLQIVFYWILPFYLTTIFLQFNFEETNHFYILSMFSPIILIFF